MADFSVLAWQRGYRASDFIVAEEVRDAVFFNKAVVALESTILTHGMPYPENLQFGHTRD